MQLLPREGWRYAALLVLLFAIAAVATHETLGYLEPRIPEHDFLVTSVLIASLMLGFMLIAGAFGLWTIRFSAEAESTRRIGDIVDRMDYIRDGVLAINRRGVITGLNPTATAWLGRDTCRGQPLTAAFDTLTEDDRALLLSQSEPCEVERDVRMADRRMSLRFRSQPAHGATLVLVSDITHMMNERVRQRQNAYLQLLGHLARGVANDFNDLLCGMSGHAAIIKRVQSVPQPVIASADNIEAGAERGLRLASRLIELANAGTGVRTRATACLSMHVRDAIALLRDGLDPAWTIEHDIADPLPPVGIAGPQVEQVVHSLGLLAADIGAAKHRLTVVAQRPAASGIMAGGPSASAVIVIATVPRESFDEASHVTLQLPGESGVLESVVAAILDEAKGGLDVVRPAYDRVIYRVRLPHAPDRDAWSQEELPEALAAYMANWHILIAGRNAALERLAAGLGMAGVAVETVTDIVPALARIERGTDLAAMLLDQELLGTEAESLLRAIVKLCPTAGVLVLCAGHTPAVLAASATANEFLTAPMDAPVAQLQRLIIESHTMAGGRRRG
jgi:nitrogen-specific signal transduction histidine kinase/CheY-like chemotaxis protein